MKKTIIGTLISLLLLNGIFVYKGNANDEDFIIDMDNPVYEDNINTTPIIKSKFNDNDLNGQGNGETEREEHEILIEDVDGTIISLESEPTEKILNNNNENISIVKENNNNFGNAPTKNFQLKDDPRVKVLGSENTINNNIKINDNLKLKIDKIEVEIPELEEQIKKIYEAINLFIKINGIK